jgi:hypothetical protein
MVVAERSASVMIQTHRVGAENPPTIYQRPLVLSAILLVQLSPVPRAMPPEKLAGICARRDQHLQSPWSSNHPP